jgi:hypothetical protein
MTWKKQLDALNETLARKNECGKGNTAEKRLRMHQIMKIWRRI